MVTKAVFFLLAVVGMVSVRGFAMAGDGDSLSPIPMPTDGRHPPTFFLMQVVEGIDHAEGRAEQDMEQGWQAQTLSGDPLKLKAEVLSRYEPDDNEGRKCARVKASIGQDLVPIKGKTYQDCAKDKQACKPFYIIAELDMCGDGLPPTANYEKYKDQAADKQWKPPVTELEGGKP